MRAFLSLGIPYHSSTEIESDSVTQSTTPAPMYHPRLIGVVERDISRSEWNETTDHSSSNEQEFISTFLKFKQQVLMPVVGNSQKV